MDCPTVGDSGVSLPFRPLGIAFDLDGTLLDYDGRLSETVTSSVRAISQSGIKVFLATGRLLSGAEEYWREFRLDTPVAACNGAYVAFPGQEPLFHARLSEKARDAVMEVERRHGLYVNYYIDDRAYSISDGPERDWYSRLFTPVERAVEAKDVIARRLPTKCLCITSEGEQRGVMEMIAAALGTDAAVTRSNDRFIEIVPPNANKGIGLRALAGWRRLPVDRFVAAGDAMNDLPMLREAGFAITFTSGDPQLAKHADLVLPPLWEDGMAILTGLLGVAPARPSEKE